MKHAAGSGMTATLEWMSGNPLIVLWAITIFAIIVLSLTTRVVQYMHSRVSTGLEERKGSESFARPRLSCFTYILIALACGNTAWHLRYSYREPMVLLALLALLAAMTYMLAKAWTDCRGPLLTVNEDGILCQRYGLIPWKEVKGVKLSEGPFGKGGEFSNLFLYVSNPEKYRAKLSRLQSFYERALSKRIVEFKDAIVINLDGFYRKPSYIFAAVEQLHRQVLRPSTKERAAEVQDDKSTKWKRVVYLLIDIIGTGAILIISWWGARN